ncbi:MAG TPA: pyridoxal phosphate-dependent aminotransferase family protein [Planctomycetota bacterium]|nr:pyridoxal phosphate-dependent aminotransferase family protein [Planctomycetota bacterium]
MTRVNFAGNDYLGLARDPRLADALCRAVREYGISSTSSRWALGWTDLHQKLEDALAAFTGAEAACITGAAYFGGPVYYSVFAGSGRVVYCDETVHSNQFLGMRAAGLEIRKFKHLDAGDLKRQLKGHKGPAPIVAADGVYGISGEVAPLAEMAEAARAVGAEIFVDDAHGFGALGASGRGSTELCGLAPAPDLTVLCSMSKAMGCNGGFLTGRKELVEKFRRSAAASGSAIPPPPIAAACLESLRIIREEPELRDKMESHARRLRAALAARGVSVVSDRTPILGMVFKDEFEAAAADKHFLKHGLVIPYFKYASEPRENLLRGAARACYTEEHLARFEKAVATLKR